MEMLSKIVESPSGFDSHSNYVGETEFPGMWCLLTRTKDSDVLSNSNFEAALTELGGEGDNVEIKRFGHWACGWWEALAVKEDTEEFKIAEYIENRLEGYSVLDENDLSGREMEEANEVWSFCYSVKERIKYIRDHPSQFSFRSFSEMRDVVKGKYFIGYPSDLIY